MKKQLVAGLLSGVAVVCLISCGPRITQDQYVKALSEIGCKQLGETSPQAKPILEQLGVSGQDINEFRKKSKRDVMMDAAMKIAQNVAKCAGVSLTN